MSLEVVSVEEHPQYPRVYIVELEDGSVRLATENLVPGRRVYGEKLYQWEGTEYREWNIYRSKLAAALVKGIEELPVKEGDKVLYLAAATGTTPSHVSDIIGEEGKLYGVEFAPRVMREFVALAEERKNMFPILGDARRPKEYRHVVEAVDGIYADVAQPNGAEIVVDNAKFFLKDGGYMLMAIKARSVDVTKSPEEVFRREIEVLKEGGFEIADIVHLDPFDRDHAMIHATFRRG